MARLSLGQYGFPTGRLVASATVTNDWNVRRSQRTGSDCQQQCGQLHNGPSGLLGSTARCSLAQPGEALFLAMGCRRTGTAAQHKVESKQPAPRSLDITAQVSEPERSMRLDRQTTKHISSPTHKALATGSGRLELS